MTTTDVPGSTTGPGTTPADAALNALLTADTSVQRLVLYAALRDRLTDLRAAVHDHHCGRVVPLGVFFSRCLANNEHRAHHTPQNCRWAVAADMPYERFPLITDSWRSEGEVT